MFDEIEVVWVQDVFTGTWEPLDGFTRDELSRLNQAGE